MRTAEGFAKLAASGPTAPRTFLNVEIGRDRRVAFVATELDALKAMRGGAEATVNDVILSVAAGALRRAFERRGERGSRAARRAGADERPPARRGARARQPDRDAARQPADRRARPGRAAGADPRRDGAAEGLGAGERRLADHRGHRVDAADDQPRARRGDRAPARLQPGRLQRPRAADAVLPARPPARGDLPVRAALAAEPRALDRGAQLRRRRSSSASRATATLLADIDELAADLERALAEQAAAAEPPAAALRRG